MIFKMNDGRQFTDYNPSCALNNFLQQKYNVQNVHEYKNYLQKNALEIQKEFLKCAIESSDENQHVVNCPVCKQALAVKSADQ